MEYPGADLSDPDGDFDSDGLSNDFERLFGLECGCSKEDTLAQLLARGRPVTFIEDRLQTLQRVAAIPGLNSVDLHYADWGYGTPADLETACASPRITVTSLNTFLA